ncbi:unnamed protein product [Phyllotreta striolata]|uniref:Uncharacterized protein n=1 Tax=Phyllotreta striolata TaxID=444603 RepID=A0A9N9TK03_PHYSR|nr:unnamed protein product [Phyllotreta striolata]
MKLILLLATVIAATQGLSVEEHWAAFKENYGKTYTSYEHEKRRFDIFQENLLLIQQHNSRYEKGETAYYMGITKFSDITDEEFNAMFSKIPKTKNGKINILQTSTTSAPLPDSVDWKAAGVLPPVVDQGDCLAGYAFSSADAFSALLFIKHNESVQLSAQELIDCTREYGNGGCRGGEAFASFLYVEEKGLRTASAYPFTGKNDACNATAASTESAVKMAEYERIISLDTAVQYYLATRGPVNADIYANPLIRHYKGGIYDDAERCPNEISLLNHGVLIVGYGTTNGTDYWFVKNSWGTKWGEEGYFKLKRSICGITMNGHVANIA